jgi:hypothetical protein
VFKKWNKLNNFTVFPIRIYHNFHNTESEEKRMSDLLLTFIPLKIFDFLYRREETAAAPEPHTNFCSELEPHKNDAALQYCCRPDRGKDYSITNKN